MGEAKSRKKIEPYFGKKPKKGRGIFLSAPITFDGKKLVAASSSIDPAELRRAALFWDRLVWPDSRIISFGSNSDEKLLESEGLLSRPAPEFFNDEMNLGQMQALMRVENSYDITIGDQAAKVFSKQHLATFSALEKEEPGQWVMAEGDGSIILNDPDFFDGRGKVVRFARAIPLPSPAMPLHDLLDFKAKRSDEIVALNYELDNFYSQVRKSSDPDWEFERLIRVIDKNCSDMIKVSRESGKSFHIGDLNFSFSLNNWESGFTRATAWGLATPQLYGLNYAASALGFGSAFVSLDKGLGLRRKANRDSPFRVVASMHKEMI